MNNGSFEEGLFNVSYASGSICSYPGKEDDFKNVSCPACGGCQTCPAQKQLQNVTSILTLLVYNSLNITCVSEQKFISDNKEFHIISKRFVLSRPMHKG